MAPEPVEYARRSKSRIFEILGASLFVALGAWLIFRPESGRSQQIIGLINVLFFGACAAIFFLDSRRRIVLLRLDASGIRYRHFPTESGFHFAWSAIAEVQTQVEERDTLLVLTLHPHNQEIPDWALARGASPAPDPVQAVISPSGVGTTADQLYAEIDRFRRHYAPSVTRPDL